LYDGRGVIIAILDSGVDPGAAGMQTTTDGKPKILDLLDCTGSGDVDTSKEVEADGDGRIEFPDGRVLAVNPEWRNPTNRWKVGVKKAFDLFTDTLIKRLKKERRKEWDKQQRECVTKVLADLYAFDSRVGGAGAALTDEQERERAEYETKLKLLKDLADSYDDQGPTLACCVWHDGDTWRAALDSSQLHPPADACPPATGPAAPRSSPSAVPSERGVGGGELASHPGMSSFRLEQQFATLSPADACNYALNVYDEGNVLSIVTDSSPHGTHVAGITAAYHPGDESQNGVAPGAQIVSCKIGDHRVGRESGVGLTRALAAVVQHKCHLINMSYGEPAAVNNKGRFVELANQVVHKHNVVFVSSAGNSGPGLSTVGAPGGTSDCIIGVGAFVSPSLANAGHSLREPLEDGLQYTWSSRGPTTDGDLGVSLSAPGGAIAPVPTWTLERRTLMNGTSMASPCVCGGIALVISAAIKENVEFSPASLRRACETTALPLHTHQPDSKCTYGHGLLQVGAAFGRLQNLAFGPDVRYEVSTSVSGSNTSGRGLYVREPYQWTGTAVEARCTIQPKMHEDVDNQTVRATFEQRLTLHSSAAWLSVPDTLLLTHNGRGFGIRAELAQVPPGSLHYAEVVARSAGADAVLGECFRVPVTLVRPIPVPNTEQAVVFEEMAFMEGHIKRQFIAVPELAGWAEITLAAGHCVTMDAPRSFMLQCVHATAHTRLDDNSMRRFFSLASGEIKSFTFAVVAGTTLEVALGQFWLSLGASVVTCSVCFHSVVTHPAGALVLDGCARATRVDCWAPLRAETLQPVVKVTAVQTKLRPTKATLSPLSAPRDQHPDGRGIHSLVLQYSLKVKEPGMFTPRLVGINRQVYDGEFEAQMYMIFDENKQLLGCGDIYPEATKLPKGDFTIRLLLRHDQADLLVKMKSMPLVVERRLTDAIIFPLSKSIKGALLGNDTFSQVHLPRGGRCPVFVAPLADDKLPKDAYGDAPVTLVGTATWGNTSQQCGGGPCPVSQTVHYIVQPKKPEEPKPSSALDEPDDWSKANMAALSARIGVLKGMKNATSEDWAKIQEAAAQLKKDLFTTSKAKLRVLSAHLTAADHKASRKNRLHDVVTCAQEVIAAIDIDSLTKFFAMKCNEEGAEAAKVKKEMEEHRGFLVSAYKSLCGALLDLEDGPIVQADKDESHEDLLETAFRNLRKWEDPTNTLLGARREARRGCIGSAIQALNKVITDSDTAVPKEVYELRILLLKELSWTHLAEHEQKCLVWKYPNSFSLF